MKLQELALDFIDFYRISYDIQNYKMLGKYSKEYMLKYIDEINEKTIKKINNNDNLEEFLNSITDEFELLCILHKFIDNIPEKILMDIKVKGIFEKYKSELMLLYYYNCDNFDLQKYTIQCKTETQSIQIVELFKKLGAINNLPKDSWLEFKSDTCYCVENNIISYKHLKNIGYYRICDFLLLSDAINQLEEKLNK